MDTWDEDVADVAGVLMTQPTTATEIAEIFGCGIPTAHRRIRATWALGYGSYSIEDPSVGKNGPKARRYALEQPLEAA